MLAIRQWLSTAWLAGAGAVTESPVFLLDYLLRALRVVVLLALWRVVLADVANPPVALASVLTYALLAEVFSDQFNVQTTLADAFWQGTIAQHFLRPMALLSQFAAALLGGWLLNFALFSLPLLLAAPLLGVDVRASSASAAALFALSLSLAVVVGLAFDFIAAALTVALEQPVWLVFWVRQAISVVLSGAVVPLALLPWGIGDAIELLPFASLAWAPLAIYTGMTAEPARLLALQLFWAAALWPLAGWLWRSNREKVVGYGG